MTQKLVLTFFLVMFLLALIGIFLYCKWLDKHFNLPQDVHIENKGVKIKGGLKHFKIVNQ